MGRTAAGLVPSTFAVQWRAEWLCRYQGIRCLANNIESRRVADILSSHRSEQIEKEKRGSDKR
jgi:hypothetical protein